VNDLHLAGFRPEFSSFVPGSIAPLEEGFPRAIQHGLDPRKCRNRRKILSSLDALPIPCAELRTFRRLFLRDARIDPHGHNISAETCATGTGHRLFRWHSAEIRVNPKNRTRGFTSFPQTATPLMAPPKLMLPGTPLACSWILLRAQFSVTIPRADKKITAANYAVTARIARSCRSQARTRKILK